MFRSRGRGPGRGGLPIFLLLIQMLQVGFDRIPPTTLVTIVGQVVIFLRLFNINYPSTSEVCISAINVWYKEDWKRLFLAAFFHAHDWHLYYNMVSFLSKGLTLERRLGTAYFAYLIAVFTLLCNITTVGLAIAAENWFHDPSYLSQCAVGFSGVVFALKVVTTYMLPPGMHYVMGIIPVPSRYAVWAELGIIHILVPNASFIGHLAGILIGLAYVKGPLKSIMDTAIPSEPTYTYQARATGHRSRFWGGGVSTGAHNPRETDRRYNRYTGGLSEEEQMAQALQRSRQQNDTRRMPEPSAPPNESHEAQSANPPASSGANRLYPDLRSQTQTVDQEELRRRRLARFH